MDAKLPKLDTLDHRTLTMALAGIRLGIGGALVVAPQFAARLWIGPGTEGAGTRVLARAIGARDVVLGYRTLQAVRGDESASGWLELGAMADAADTVAGLLAIRGIPGHRRFTMPLVAGAVGAACFWAARQGSGTAATAAADAAPDGAGAAPEPAAPDLAPDEIDLDELVDAADDLPDAGAGGTTGRSGAAAAGNGGAPDAPDDELDDAAAAALLEVTVDRVEVLVTDGMLTPIGGDPRRFRRADVLAVRLVGG
jgi:hypothetical protein